MGKLKVPLLEGEGFRVRAFPINNFLKINLEINYVFAKNC